MLYKIGDNDLYGENMANLILIKNKNETINMNEIEVHPEEKIRDLLFETEKILPDIFFLKKEHPTYKGKRMDLVGLDKDNNIVIVEVKDELVEESVISQVMEYAMWVESNPDSIKTLWYEHPEKPEFNWESDVSIRILIVGPSFKPNVLKFINKIDYKIELVEFKKFNDGNNDLIFLNTLEAEKEMKYKASKYQGEYDLNFYKKNYNSNSAEIFIKIADKIEKFVKKRGWNLDRKNNKGYISFKYGFPIVFGIQFVGSKSMCLFYKLPKNIVDSIKIEGEEPYRYEEEWKQILYKVEASNIDLKKYNRLFEEAYKNIVGK
jgi:hypothetical protein